MLNWNWNRRVVVACLFALMPWTIVADAATPQGSPRSASPAGASVSFVNLADGDIVPLTFTLRFAISGMTIATAGTQIESTGHHHLLIDVDQLPDLNLPLPKNDNIRHFGGGETEVTLNLPAGQHSLQLLLADYAHIAHQPAVLSDRITVTVSADAAALADE